MSRIGRLPVALPAGVEVKVDGNNVVTVKGPKGELQEQISKLIKVEINGDTLTVTRDSDDKTHILDMSLLSPLTYESFLSPPLIPESPSTSR